MIEIGLAIVLVAIGLMALSLVKVSDDDVEEFKKITDEELLEKYFLLAFIFDSGLDDAQLDKLFTLEDEILRRMKKDEI